MKKTITIMVFALIAGTNLLFAQENVLEPNGNAGIGTTNPSEKLEVNGNVKIDSSLMIHGDILVNGLDGVSNFSSSKLLFIDSLGYILKGDSDDAIQYIGNAMYSKQCSADPFGDVQSPYWNNGVNKLYTDCPPVYVGINTDDPKVHLDVHGKTSTGYLAVGVDPLSMLGKVHIKTNIPHGTDGIVLVAENNARRLMELDNTGLLRAREIKVDAQVWPDYVFEKEYILMPLEDVEVYIQENGHLPNIPSAEEIEMEGMNVSEMNKLLLEKIEELTLYMLEQQKLIDAQNERLQKLENK